ncbi:peptidase S8/S53 domain-containing protein [Phycomyces nitens]|nr:peptidase S8/S53 domain-containing protein [Phycomyces nitens]
MRFSIIASVLLVASGVSAGPVWSNPSSNLAPLYVSNEAETVSDSYIVVLKDHLTTSHVEQHANWLQSMVKSDDRDMWLNDDRQSNTIRHVYETPSIRGYSGTFDQHILHQIRQSDDVAFVERDSMVYASELQRDAPWGLARVSHREGLTLENKSTYDYSAKGGEGIKVYVIDTGINVDHADFEGRATWGKTVPRGDPNADGNGHGSHCAGTIAGKRFGVAKKAEPVAVKVLRSNGSGTMSDVISGVDWATGEHIKAGTAAKKAGKTFKGSAANMSLGGGRSPSLDRFVNAAVEEGIVFAVAAGNDNSDACDYSPAAAELAITVGASTLYDDRAYFSNYGPCVDVFAPGMNILSVWKGGKNAVNTISGTSMASPHVAGLAAYFLSLEDGLVTPKEIKDKILQLATKDALTKIPRDTPNLLIYNNYKPDEFTTQGLKAILGDI